MHADQTSARSAAKPAPALQRRDILLLDRHFEIETTKGTKGTKRMGRRHGSPRPLPCFVLLPVQVLFSCANSELTASPYGSTTWFSHEATKPRSLRRTPGVISFVSWWLCVRMSLGCGRAQRGLAVCSSWFQAFGCGGYSGTATSLSCTQE